MKYSYLSIRNDIVKLSILFSVALWMNRWKESILFLVPFMLIRILLGGIHCRSSFGCLILTGLWVALGVGLSILLEDAQSIVFLLTIVSVAAPICCTPVASKKRRRIGEIEKKRRQRISIIIELSVFAFLLIVNMNRVLKNCACMALLNNNCQLLFLNARFKNGGGDITCQSWKD